MQGKAHLAKLHSNTLEKQSKTRTLPDIYPSTYGKTQKEIFTHKQFHEQGCVALSPRLPFFFFFFKYLPSLQWIYEYTWG